MARSRRHDRLTVGVGRQRIGAELEEQVHHLRTIHDDGVMERQAVVLVAAQPAVERRGIGRDDSPDLVAEVHRDRREDVMARAVAQQDVHHAAVRRVVAPVPAGRPADDFELVVVAVTDDVAAGVGEAPHDVDVAGGRGPVDGVGVVAFLAGVHVKAAPQQQIDRGEVPLVRRDVQQRPRVRRLSRVQLVGMGVEQRTEPVGVALLGCVEELFDPPRGLDGRRGNPVS